MLIKLLLLTLLSVYATGDNIVCTPTAGTYVALTEEDLYDISNCTYIDGNLFIHGGVNVYDLSPLNNLETINGYLVIWNNQRLTDLRGLNNLRNITGKNLYLELYSLYIKDNFWNSHVHDGNTTRTGLCYVNTVNWNTILNNNSLLLDNNGENCNGCYSECNGCFDEGPQMCQRCKHYNSGTLCVSQCPVGTINNGIECNESYPEAPANVSVNILNYSSVNVTWNIPEIPRGIITEYRIYQDDNIIREHHCELDTNDFERVAHRTHNYIINNFEYGKIFYWEMYKHNRLTHLEAFQRLDIGL